jgi:type II secretory pathway component PulK
MKTDRTREDHSFSHSKPRTGMLTISLLVTLTVGSLILIGAIALTLKLHRQTRNERMAEQTRWILDGGISHAIAALETNQNYSGETLQLNDSIKEYQATLIISVTRTASDQQFVVDVIAKLMRANATPIDVAFQRSIRFQFFP